MNKKKSIVMQQMETLASGRGLLRGIAIAVAALSLTCFAGIADSSAQRQLSHRGTPEEQEACRPDVFRLCFSSIPDEPRIVACLQHRKEQLSPACRAVIDPPPPRSKRKARTKKQKPRARQ